MEPVSSHASTRQPGRRDQQRLGCPAASSPRACIVEVLCLSFHKTNSLC